MSALQSPFKFSGRIHLYYLSGNWGASLIPPTPGAEAVSCEYIFDTLSRQLRETQTIGTRAPLNVDTEWQGATRRVSDTYPNGRKILRSYDALDRQMLIGEAATGTMIVMFDYVGPFRDIRTEYGNGAVLDKRNAAGSQTISGTNPGYDLNRRHVRHEWKTAASAQITAYVNTYNDSGLGDGIGTNRRISELREHLNSGGGGQKDLYTFDSAYRMTAFIRNADGLGVGGASSTRSLDGVDNMTSFNNEGAKQSPVVSSRSDLVRDRG